MVEYIKLTFKKLAIILISIIILVAGLSYCESSKDHKKDIEAVQDVTRNQAQV